MPITFAQAALGDTIEVPTIHGEQEVEIRSGIQSGETITLSGKGVPNPNGKGNGDQIITVKLETPTKLNKEEKDLFNQLKQYEKREKKWWEGLFS